MSWVAEYVWLAPPKRPKDHRRILSSDTLHFSVFCLRPPECPRVFVVNDAKMIWPTKAMAANHYAGERKKERNVHTSIGGPDIVRGLVVV